MKIKIISDIHLEFGKWPTINNNGCDLLILSGDICVAKHSLEYLDWFQQTCSQFTDVIYVMGNHEHYHGCIDTSLKNLYKLKWNDTGQERLTNLHIFENQCGVLNGVKVFGGTLWTNCNNNDWSTKQELKYGMNDYRLIRNQNGDRLTPDETIELHNEYLKTIEKEKPDIVITHHAPSTRSIHENYKIHYKMNGGYCSDLESFIMENQNIKLWTHGHVHSSFDYNIGNTRVICNPSGYPGSMLGRENKLWDPKMVIEI